MPVVGLDISDTSMRFIELIEMYPGLTIGRFGEQAIPRGVIESGEVKKPLDLRAMFVDLKNKYNLEFVSVCLPEEKVYLFNLQLPMMKYSEIRGAIELEIENHVPMKVSEVLFDYGIEKEDDTTIQINVSAVSFSLIDGYLEAFSGTGITPTIFEIEAQSLARAVVPRGDENSTMIIDLGKTRTGITIVDTGVVQFTSTIPIGGALLTEAIAKSLNISYDDAEKIKREKGVLSSDASNEVSMALSSRISALRSEIHKNYTYWQTRVDEYGKKRPPIQKVYFCGGDANLPGLIEYLTEVFDVPVVLADVLCNMNSIDRYIPEINFRNSLSYATAIGLALRRQQ